MTESRFVYSDEDALGLIIERDGEVITPEELDDKK